MIRGFDAKSGVLTKNGLKQLENGQKTGLSVYR